MNNDQLIQALKAIAMRYIHAFYHYDCNPAKELEKELAIELAKLS
jgi:hypothetical protein